MSKSMKYYLPLILVLLVGIFGGLLLVAKKESLNMGIKEANPVGDPDVELTTVTVAGEQGKRYWLALNADGSSVGTSVTAGFGANSGIDPSAVSWRIDPSSTSKVSASLSGARSGVFSAIGTNSGGWLANTFRVYGSYNGKELSTSVTVYVYCRWEPGSRNDSSDKAYGPYSSRRSGRASHTGDSSCHAYEGETVENGVYYYARYYNRCCGNNPETPIATKACYVNSATNDYQYVEQSPGDGYVKDTTLNETTCKPSNVCFTNSAGTEFKWQATYPGTGWSIVTGKTEDTCKACFVNSATNDYQWTTQSPGSGYTKSTTITTEGSCKPSKVCFSNSTGTEFKWQEAYPGSGWSIVTGKNEDTCKTCFIDYTNYQATWATKAPSSAYTKYDTTKGDCKCGNVTINKRDSKTLTQITGATLNLTNYGTLTGKTNTITLCPGKTYKLTETTAPSNYIKWTGSENLTVSNGNVNKATVNVDNIPCPKVTIKKVDENNALLSGATLKLTNYGNITDNEKVITLCPNTYVLSETAAPAGYVLSTETVTITVGNDGAASQSTISFRNTPNKLQINKVSDDDEMIAGSVLGLYQNNELKYQCTSTQSGCIIEKIVPGEYVLKEISQTEGYLLSTKTYAVRVNNDGKISIDSGEYSGVATVKFVNQANELIIDKVNWSGTALAGSNLGLYQGDELKYQCTSTLDGCVIKAIVPGEYVLKEITPTQGYILSGATYPVKVNEDGIISLNKMNSGSVVLNFANNINRLNIKKVDENNSYLAGSVLGLYQGDEVKFQCTSTSTGCTIEGIIPGDYILKEVTPTSGYAKSTKEYSVNVANNGLISVNEQRAVSEAEFTYENKPNKLTINKVDEEDKPVIGVRLALYQGNEIKYSCDSNSNGCSFTKIVPGTYILKEIAVPIEYYLSDKTYTVVVDANGYISVDNGTLLGEQTFKFVNIKMPEVRIHKLNADTLTYVQGATIVIKDVRGNVIEEYVTDDTSHNIRLPYGTYTIVETVKPAAYINYAGETITLDENTPKTYDVKLYNEPYYTVKLVKLGEGGKHLAGARFEILDSNDEVVSEVTTTEEFVLIDFLPKGSYKLVEKEAPEGYALNDTVVEFTIDGSVQVVEMNVMDQLIIVPNTAKFTSVILLSLALGFTGYYVLKYSKKLKNYE